MKTSQFKLSELVKDLDVTIQGDPECVITGVSPVHQAQSGHITFLTNAHYRKFLPGTQASAVILKQEDAEDCKVNAVISANPYYTYARIADYFDSKFESVAGIHASAVIGKNCDIHPSASIGPNCTVGDHVQIGPQAVIGPNCTLGDYVKIGSETRLDAGVSLYHHVTIGQRSRLASGVVVGSDGFGFANNKGVWHKVPQLGSVEIGNDVDIGSNTTIDRGAVENTVIEDGVKLDNLIQVGHNVRIGAHTVVAGCAGIAGSTIIGKYCMIGGAANFAGHLSVADKVIITGMTAVTKSIQEPGMYSSGIVGAVPNHEFLKNNARFHRLEQLQQRVKALETAIKEMTEKRE
jgi:UDP-3-O-[3-hydroxymyristoyl] glucosamine N-acyltransferase